MLLSLVVLVLPLQRRALTLMLHARCCVEGGVRLVRGGMVGMQLGVGVGGVCARLCGRVRG